jgi:hypothetical protein
MRSLLTQRESQQFLLLDAQRAPVRWVMAAGRRIDSTQSEIRFACPCVLMIQIHSRSVCIDKALMPTNN